MDAYRKMYNCTLFLLIDSIENKSFYLDNDNERNEEERFEIFYRKYKISASSLE